METNWKEYFTRLAETEVEEHKKVGWGSKESMYSKFYTALDLLPLDGNERLLDIGCGTGAFEELLLSKYPSLEIHAMDISAQQLQFLKQRNLPITVVTAPITDIPYLDSFFDCVTCFGVLQNFNGSVNLAIKEMARVLKKKGELFIITMDAEHIGFKSGERRPNPLQTYFVPEELKKMVETEGVAVIRHGCNIQPET